MQNGCYWRQQHTHPANATESHNTQEGVALAEISLTDTSSEGSEEAAPLSEVPEPDSRGQATASPTSPITIGSTEEDNGCSRNNDTEPSEEETPRETITSMSEGDKIQEGGMDAIPTSPAAIEAARAAEQREQMEGERAEETESGTTDEVIDIDVGDEAIPAQTSSSPNETRATALAQTASHSLGRQRLHHYLLQGQPQKWKKQA